MPLNFLFKLSHLTRLDKLLFFCYNSLKQISKMEKIISSLVKNHTLFMWLLILSIIIFWANTFHEIEWWTHLDSLYFIISTVTTVWYWDFVPTTDSTKILTMLFSISVIPLLFYLWPKFLDKSMTEKINSLRNKLNKDIKKVEENVQVDLEFSGKW